LLRGYTRHDRVANGSVQSHPDGLLVSWKDPGQRLEIVLDR